MRFYSGPWVLVGVMPLSDRQEVDLDNSRISLWDGHSFEFYAQIRVFIINHFQCDPIRSPPPHAAQYHLNISPAGTH